MLVSIWLAILIAMARASTATQPLPDRCHSAQGFMSPARDQCFMYFGPATGYPVRLWKDAEALCKSKGLHLAEPFDGTADWLRYHIITTYDGFYHTWIGGHGNGRWMVWDRDYTRTIPRNKVLWYPDMAGYNDNLLLATETHWLRTYNTKPYGVLNGAVSGYRTLCELI